MHKLNVESLDLRTLASSTNSFVRVGWLVRVDNDGAAFVDFPGSVLGPVRARSVLNQPSDQEEAAGKPTALLLVFEDNKPSLPIIVGVVNDVFRKPLQSPSPDAVLQGKKRIVFDATEEIALRSGKSSLLLRKDGKIVVKGSRIVSRSSGTHKIKGGTVEIN